MPSGGDIIEITYSNAEVGNGVIRPKSAVDSTYDLGGIRSGDDANMTDTAGNRIYQMNMVSPMFQVDITWDMINRNDLEVLNDLASSAQETTWTFANINGTIYKLTGKPSGDLTGNGNTSNITLKVMGSGKMFIIS